MTTLRLDALPTMHLSAAAAGTAKTLALASAGMGLAFTLPDPISLLTFAGSAGLALGTAAGAFYGAWLKGTAKARAEAYALMDEAHRASTLFRLEEATAKLGESSAELATLRADLDRVRAENRQVQEDLIGFAKTVLREHRHIEDGHVGGGV